MCQGLPCIGHKVQLKSAFLFEGSVIPKGEIGVVEEEFSEAREVLVFFARLRRRARVPEAYLRSLPGGTTPRGGTKGGNAPRGGTLPSAMGSGV
jgi:hypothetical protein